MPMPLKHFETTVTTTDCWKNFYCKHSHILMKLVFSVFNKHPGVVLLNRRIAFHQKNNLCFFPAEFLLVKERFLVTNC